MAEKKNNQGETEIVIDLGELLTPVELLRFRQNAADAGAVDLTEHFKNVFLKVPELKVS
jgi:hypothetical protein